MFARFGTAALLLASLAFAPGSVARESDARGGNSIIPTFSLQHEALEPNQDAELVACVTNSNPRSTRELEPGDSFFFAFADGALGACAGVEVFSRSGVLDDADFECTVAGGVLALEYVGREAVWEAGDVACGAVGYRSGTRSSTVLTRTEVRNAGAYAATQPAVLFLSVAPGIGIVGPEGPQGVTGATGPAGPIGPAGPRGASGVGNTEFATSTGAVRLSICDPPTVVPGLEASMSVEEGSRLLVQVDADQHNACPSSDTVRSAARLLIEVDGATAAARELSWIGPGPGDGTTTAVSMIYQSEPLAAGQHDVRILLEEASHPAFTSCTRRTLCVGSAEDDGHQARLLVMELRAE